MTTETSQFSDMAKSMRSIAESTGSFAASLAKAALSVDQVIKSASPRADVSILCKQQSSLSDEAVEVYLRGQQFAALAHRLERLADVERCSRPVVTPGNRVIGKGQDGADIGDDASLEDQLAAMTPEGRAMLVNRISQQQAVGLAP